MGSLYAVVKRKGGLLSTRLQ